MDTGATQTRDGSHRRELTSGARLTSSSVETIPTLDAPQRPSMAVRFRSTNSIINAAYEPREPMADSDWEDMDDEEDRDASHTQIIRAASPVLQPRRQHRVFLHQFSVMAFVIAIAILITQQTLLTSDTQRPFLGASAAAFTRPNEDNALTRRADSPTDVCKRWAHQSALVNGTLYLYGGRATTSSSQISDTWNNNFLTLDLTKSWTITSPSLTGLPQPSGPPSVAMGYIWNSYDSLFLYGGQFSDSPQASPLPNSLWEYTIGSNTWKERTNPKTSGGLNAEAAGQSIERSAEGAGFSMAALGKGWYFGGHLDFLTTKGWSIQTPRLYLKSFIEYTFPGYRTADGRIAGSDGDWRNITSGGIQDQVGFTERADGILKFVPGFGAQGILISLGGGTNVSFTQMNIIDVFDVETSKWYRQATSGPTPKIRVNPCAVVAAALDGSSYNIYMFGGQNLIPYGEQIQYNDMWILSVPSFTWIQVDMKGQSVPSARAGHTCNIWDGQMVLVGGYLGQDIACEPTGTYVFNLSSLSWENQFTSLSNTKTNPFSQHPNQHGTNASSGLQGSYGYFVPEQVYKAIGGSSMGGATVTAPVQKATGGPLVSGRPVVYPGFSNERASGGARIGAIVAGTLAGVLFLVAVYLAFCAYVYRKQLKLYREHITMAQRSSTGPLIFGEKMAGFEPPTGLAATLAATPGSGSWSRGSYHRTSESAISGSGSGGDGPSSTGYNPHQVLGDGPNAGLLWGGRVSDEVVQDEDEDLLAGLEPTFVGVMLHPRRSLRIVNRD